MLEVVDHLLRIKRHDSDPPFMVTIDGYLTAECLPSRNSPMVLRTSVTDQCLMFLHKSSLALRRNAILIHVAHMLKRADTFYKNIDKRMRTNQR